jgi:hypothetical protein
MSRARTLVDQPDLLIAGLAAVLAGIAGLGALDGLPILHALLTIPLVLFLPGYALVSAVFPTLVVPSVERLLMSVGGSIAISVLVGLGLGISPFGLNAGSWAVVLVALTLGLLVVAWVRRARAGVVGARPRIASMPLRAAVLMVISVLIVADVVLGARLAATEAQAPVPVQLWLIPVSGAHEQARLGVNSGADGGDFRIVLTTQGETIHSFDVTLGPEQTWETVVLFPEEIRAQPIVARLYEGSSLEESRFVTLQPVTDAAPPSSPSGSPAGSPARSPGAPAASPLASPGST